MLHQSLLQRCPADWTQSAFFCCLPCLPWFWFLSALSADQSRLCSSAFYQFHCFNHHMCLLFLSSLQLSVVDFILVAASSCGLVASTFPPSSVSSAADACISVWLWSGIRLGRQRHAVAAADLLSVMRNACVVLLVPASTSFVFGLVIHRCSGFHFHLGRCISVQHAVFWSSAMSSCSCQPSPFVWCIHGCRCCVVLCSITLQAWQSVIIKNVRSKFN